jgi:hypothetical protein
MEPSGVAVALEHDNLGIVEETALSSLLVRLHPLTEGPGWQPWVLTFSPAAAVYAGSAVTATSLVATIGPGFEVRSPRIRMAVYRRRTITPNARAHGSDQVQLRPCERGAPSRWGRCRSSLESVRDRNRGAG